MGRFLSIFALFFRSAVARFELHSPSRTPYVSEQTRNLRLDVLVGRLEDCLSSVHMECFVQSVNSMLFHIMTAWQVRAKHDFILSMLPFDELLKFRQALVDINVGIDRFCTTWSNNWCWNTFGWNRQPNQHLRLKISSSDIFYIVWSCFKVVCVITIIFTQFMMRKSEVRFIIQNEEFSICKVFV